MNAPFRRRTARDAYPNLDRTLSELRALRVRSHQTRYGDMPPPRLPSRETIIEIVGGLVAALFPRHHGPPGLAGGDLDAFAEARPVSTLRSLEGQIRFELELAEGHLSEPVGDRDVRAAEITSAFAEGLGSTRAITQARTRNEAFEDGGGI